MRALLSLSLLLLLPAGDRFLGAQAPPPRAQAFEITETTIADIHDAMRGGRLTCRALVEAYQARIDAHDTRGAAINALVQINADALRTADELDGRFRAGGLTGPLHCIPMIVKDNFETIGLQSAAGSLALQGFVSDKDAFLFNQNLAPSDLHAFMCALP